MSTAGWIMLVVHMGLFVYLRITLSRKARRLEKELADANIKYRLLNEKHSILQKMLDNTYGKGGTR